MKSRIFVLSLVLSAIFLNGCAGSSLSGLGEGIFSRNGNSLLDEGGKLFQAARGLDEEQEYYLGRGVGALVLSKYQPLNNDALNRYVNKVGLTVAAHSERPVTFGGYHFLVLNSPEVNAISAPGGFVFVTKGLVKLAPNEDALAAVLAHEVAHVVKGHGRKAISQANLTSALLAVGKEAAASEGNIATQELVSAFGNSVQEVFGTLIEKGYSRGQEYDADEMAVEIMKKAGYQTSAMLDMLNALKAREGKDSGGWYETHPKASNRIGNIDGDIKPNPEADKGLKIRTARFKSALGGAA